MDRFIHWRRGFALGDAVSLVAVIIVMASVLIAASHGTRREARLASDFAKLRRIAGYTESYAADFQDHFWSFSWQEGTTPSQYPDLQNANSNQQAAAHQAVDIMRRVGGRTDIPAIFSMFPFTLYSHLPLIDWAGMEMPCLDFIPDGDRHRLQWANDPIGFDLGKFSPYQPSPSPVNKRWPYSSGFELTFGAWERSEVGSRVQQVGSPTTSYIVLSTSDMGSTMRSLTHYPAWKSLVHSANDWHSRREGVAMFYPEGRVPLIAVDGHSRTLPMEESNLG